MSPTLVARLAAWTLAALVPALVTSASAQPAPAPADRYIQRAWDSRDGLPQNTVTSIVQTRDGYLWLGTFGGLVRFDGNSFTVFDPGNTPGLASNRIVTLHEDRDGTLWIGTEGGLSRLHAGVFTTYTTRDGLVDNGINEVATDRHGRLWIGTGSGLMRFDGRTFTHVPLDAALQQGIIAFAETPEGDWWMGSWVGTTRLGEGKSVIYPASHGRARLLATSKGRLWWGGPGLAYWDGARFVNVPLPLPGEQTGRITALAEDRDGSLWIGTERGGLLHWRDGVVERYDTTGELSSNFVRSVLVDRDGNVWVGTDVGGVYRLKRRRVHSYQRPGSGSADQSIGPIVGDGAGGLWIGATCGGLLHFHQGIFRTLSLQEGLAHSCVWAIHRDRDGTLWLGTLGGGVMQYRGGRFTQWGYAHGLSSELVSVLRRDGSGVLWVGTSRGLSRFDGGRFTNFGEREGIAGTVRTITEDRNGALWLGAEGLLRFQDGRVIARYTTADGLAHNLVRAIYEDADGVLWIGTYGGGLSRFKDGRFTTYGIKEGLHDIAVSRIIDDDRGNLWMSGNKGVFRVARSQLNEFAEGKIAHITSVSYGTADGMIIDETNGGQPAGWRTADGTLWFPTIKGLVSIEPDLATPAAPPVFVERTIVDGAATDATALQQLGPGRTDAEFHYTAVDLGAAEKTRFRYRLAGYDPAWIDAGDRRVAYYTNIPPGRYRFEVAATDSDGRWMPAPAGTALVVTPFWWQRRPVQGVGLILLLVASGYGVRFISLRRARARVAQLEREQALERERARIARDLHDDLGSRLAQIALIAESPSGAQSVDRISGVAREAMHTMDELVWTVNARNDTVESLAEFAAEFAEEHLSLAGVRYRFDFQSDLEGRLLHADTRRHLFLAYKEAIHNVVKHAGASEVHVGLTVDGRTLVLEVIDDGRGFPPDQPGGTGNGLRNMKERMAAAGGRLDIESPAAGGTRLVFRAPVAAS